MHEKMRPTLGQKYQVIIKLMENCEEIRVLFCTLMKRTLSLVEEMESGTSWTRSSTSSVACSGPYMIDFLIEGIETLVQPWRSQVNMIFGTLEKTINICPKIGSAAKKLLDYYPTTPGCSRTVQVCA